MIARTLWAVSVICYYETTVNKLRKYIPRERSGGSGRPRRAKPEEAGARGSSVKKGRTWGAISLTFGIHVLPLINLVTLITKLIPREVFFGVPEEAVQRDKNGITAKSWQY
jgi:hypothetical protein